MIKKINKELNKPCLANNRILQYISIQYANWKKTRFELGICKEPLCAKSTPIPAPPLPLLFSIYWSLLHYLLPPPQYIFANFNLQIFCTAPVTSDKTQKNIFCKVQKNCVNVGRNGMKWLVFLKCLII